MAGGFLIMLTWWMRGWWPFHRVYPDEEGGPAAPVQIDSPSESPPSSPEESSLETPPEETPSEEVSWYSPDYSPDYPPDYPPDYSSDYSSENPDDRPENELVSRKPTLTPLEEEVQEALPAEVEEPLEEESVQEETPATAEAESEPVVEERAMVESALMVMERTGDPVGYMDLINQVYMDLIDKRVSFESPYQIEATLLKHLENELAILDEPDESGKGVVRKWWFGEGAMPAQVKGGRKLRARLADVKKRVPNVKGLLEKHVPHHPRSRPRRQVDEDAEIEELENLDNPDNPVDPEN